MAHRHSLSYGASPRASPFRRPESPASPSPLRQSTSNVFENRPSSNSISTPTPTPSRLTRDTTKAAPYSPGSAGDVRTPRMREPFGDTDGNAAGASRASTKSAVADGNALSKLQAAQVRELREGFQTLDRDGDGLVNRDDVIDMFAQLGMTASQSELAAFFPPGEPQTMTLPTYMNSIAASLAALSPSTELLSAFSAFDEDENGQADLADLRNSLLQTAPEPGEKPLNQRDVDKVLEGFTGKRAFGKHSAIGMGKSKKGDVFRYQEFVSAVSGGAEPGKGGRHPED